MRLSVTDSLRQDLRYSARLLRKAPGFTITAIVVIALGIGANCAIFSLVDVVLFRPLPYANPEQLVRMWEHPPGFARNSVSPLNFSDYREQNQVFASMAGIAGLSPTLTAPNSNPERIAGQAVTEEFFDVLGVKPLAGRTFTAEDVRPEARVVVLSESLWRVRVGGDPVILVETPTNSVIGGAGLVYASEPGWEITAKAHVLKVIPGDLFKGGTYIGIHPRGARLEK